MIALFLIIAIVSFSLTISTDEAWSLRESDFDRDGILDEVDECPQTSETYNKFQDSDGCPDSVSEEIIQYQFPDTDVDGLEDRVDNCVTLPETFNGYLDFDGCPDLIPDSNDSIMDSDSDTIPDSIDACPNEKETINEFKDGDGCPNSFIPSYYDSKGLSFVSHQCGFGKALVLRINSQNTDCVTLDTAKKWKEYGIAEIILKPTPDEGNLVVSTEETIEKLTEYEEIELTDSSDPDPANIKKFFEVIVEVVSGDVEILQKWGYDKCELKNYDGYWQSETQDRIIFSCAGLNFKP
jgi:hypothetical protein